METEKEQKTTKFEDMSLLDIANYMVEHRLTAAEEVEIAIRLKVISKLMIDSFKGTK